MEQTSSYPTLESIVVHGQQLGRKLGYPTANLGLDTLRGTLPSTGVYAAICTLADNSVHKAMLNIGYRPTVNSSDHTLTIEAHILHFNGDIYGQPIKLQIISRIRDERRMTSLAELKLQLAQDLQQVDIINVSS